METAKLLFFGLPGHCLHFTTTSGAVHCSSNGYETPESFCKPEFFASRYGEFHYPVAGLPVIDVRKAVESKDGFSWVFKSPMLQCERETDEGTGSMHYVTVETYLKGWREHGARIGKLYSAGPAAPYIEWEGGE